MITKRTELRLPARTHTRKALAVLAGLAYSDKVPPRARIAAAIALLDRAWGRPALMLATEEGNPLAVHITEIINDIVDPPPYEDDDVAVIEGEVSVTPQLEPPAASPDLEAAAGEDPAVARK